MSEDAYPQHRPNVGIALFNSLGEVWIGKRDAAEPPWQWQLPQGGIDPGEAPEDAALRELYEETGVKPELVEPLGAIDRWIAYDYPPDVRDDPRFARKRHLGQKQRWFAYRFNGSAEDFDLEAHGEVEFCDWRWGRLEELPDLIIPWKRETYVQVMREFSRFAIPARASKPA
ncbi:RNA pyrophosphohydrolase [Maricaulis sp.]|uniref:RNA pyrophosphohydrolase n=1 Tax=unclassified Maricaulis TaxID=2632371 RepID=UPI001B11BD39|nr:RNA pyrophosphohydrolase [Maricaulis sp.]MBO6795946.1 RNA pyrophosphohydrolase [Maricaulis sp.]